MGYSCRTLLRDALVRHSSGTLLRDTLVGHSSSSSDTPRTKVVVQARQFSASSSTDCSAYKFVLQSHQFSSSSSPDTPQTKVALQSRQCSPAFRALDTRDLRRGLRGAGQIALSPAFRALDARDLRRGLHGHWTNRTLACISPLDTRDLRRGLRAHGTNRALAGISHTRHARSPQRVARAWDKSHSGLHFAHSTRTISAEGCASSLQNERFVRDVLKNSHVKVCKASVSYETSSKSQVETPIGAHTHHAALPSSFAIPASPNNVRSHQSQCDSDIRLYHNSPWLSDLTPVFLY